MGRPDLKGCSDGRAFDGARAGEGTESVGETNLEIAQLRAAARCRSFGPKQ